MAADLGAGAHSGRRPLRVLLVTASAGRRGAEIQATQLADHLARDCVAAKVVALSTGTTGEPLPVPALGPRRLSIPTLRRLRQLARVHDVVVAYGSTTLPASSLALIGIDTPLVYRSISDPTFWLRGRLHRATTALQYRRPSRIVALWPGAADSIAASFDVDRSSISVIPNARDDAVFRPPTMSEREASRHRLGVGDRSVVAFIGSIAPEKRIDLAIDAVARLPGHLLIACGAGTGLAAAREHAARVLGDRALWLGELDDVRPLLRAADALLISSAVEGMPGAAIEAGLCGVPVVATPVGALPTMPWVALAEARPEALAAAVARATTSTRGVHEAVAAYTWRNVARRWVTVLGEAAECPGTRRCS
jgi:glycosyltransferase involved in cell wall biosynthesis